MEDRQDDTFPGVKKIPELLQVNQIPAIQNSGKQLTRLRAQRRFYSRAKTLLAAQMILSVPFAVFWSVMGILAPDTKAYAALWGIGVTLLDLILFTPWQKTLKRKAAKIQEAFDCDVLSLEWRFIHVGPRPDPEDLTQWSRFRSADEPTVQNWYPTTVGELPLPLARVICQRANCWWDAELRRRYARAALAIIAVIFAITLVTGLAGHFTIDHWILNGVTPLVPVFILGMRQLIDQKEAADRLDALRRHAEGIWQETLAGIQEDRVTQQSRELQDEIYNHRCRNPLIFDWIYKLLWNRQEEQMNRAASDLVEEARSRLKLDDGSRAEGARGG
jgi:hypothetical protein